MNTQFRKTILSTAVLSATLGTSIPVAIAQGAQLEEVIVTATRRDVSVQDVPYNISAITGSDLAENGVNGAADLFRIASGVNFIEQGPRSGVNNSNLIMRGVNAETLSRNSGPLATAPVVSTYINETPVFVNLRLKDLDRVEVLRGPQGTLYGSGSLGGSVRYIYNKPTFDEFAGEISGGVSQTENGDGINYETDLMLNIPLGDSFGVRVNAGYADYAGFIDQPWTMAPSTPSMTRPISLPANRYLAVLMVSTTLKQPVLASPRVGRRVTDLKPISVIATRPTMPVVHR